MINICLLVHRRHYRLPEICRQLREQTYQDFKLNIWNNSPDKYCDIRNLGKKRANIINALGGNQGSCARFKLAKQTGGNPIIFIDDDLELEKDFIEYLFKMYNKYGGILSWWSKAFKSENYHNANCLLPEGQRVDYLGTGGMILDRWIIDNEESLQNIPKHYSRAEDLYLSAIARIKYKMELRSLDAKCSIVEDPYDQHRVLKKYKQKAFKQLRKEGWGLLKDKV